MLLLGRHRDHQDAAIELPSRALLRHMMALGSSGSGKTVLSKVVVEEMVRAGVPALCLDPQGDLCSLALAAQTGDEAALRERGVDPALAREFAERTDVVVFTPASNKGVALGADPLAAVLAGRGAADDDDVWTRAAGNIAALLGYSRGDDDGEGLIAVLDAVLQSLADADRSPASLGELTGHLADLDEAGLRPYARFWELDKLRRAIRKLARLEVGPRRKLFASGVPLDIDLLLGSSSSPGKTRVAIVYLNSLHTQEDKEFLVAAIAERLYAWMLARPSTEPQLLFYLDEIAPYVPPVRKPQCKDSLQLLFKQARKYGVCCLMATQNPGDVDYRAMAQFGTWALGRLTTRQDLKKVEPTVKSLAPDDCDGILAELPRLEPGQFVLLSPDHFDAPARLQTRWLLTRHETLDDGRIAELADARWRDRFAGLIERGAPSKRGTKRRPKPEPAPEAPAPPEPPTPSDPDSPEPEPPRPEPPRPKPPRPQPPQPEPPGPKPTKPAADPKPTRRSRAEAKASERQRQLETLRVSGPVDVRQFASLLGCSESKARRALKLLVEAGLVGDFKRGRSSHFWALDTGARPDLDMPERVLVARPALGQDQIAAIAQGSLRSSVVATLTGAGPIESLVNVSLIHRLLWRVDFEERIEAGLLGRLAKLGGPAHEDRIGSVYFHPRTLALLTWSGDRGLRFVAPEQPVREHASDVHDLDGEVRFVAMAPGGLRFDERDWAEREPAERVAATFAERWPARITEIRPVFLSLWKLAIHRHEPAGMRVALLDAIAGKPVDWAA